MYYERSSAKIFWISFLTSLIVSGLVSFSVIYFVPDFLEKSEEVKIKVPDVEGLDLQTAEMVMDRSDLLLAIERVDDPNVEKDKVIYQNPAPGTELVEGGKVEVVVSNGPPLTPEEEKEQIIVPDVTGFELNQARVFLSEKGLNVGKVEEEISEEPEGEVISIVPDPGTKITEDVPVKLIISAGPGKVAVPNIKRKTVSQARQILRESGLQLGNVREITSPEYPFDIIISQDPQAGNMIKKGLTVNVTVNREAY